MQSIIDISNILSSVFGLLSLIVSIISLTQIHSTKNEVKEFRTSFTANNSNIHQEQRTNSDNVLSSAGRDNNINTNKQ
jgi:hypothetical protein